MELNDLLEICKSWDRMGWAVQEQLVAVMDGQPMEDQNPNALEMARDFLRDVDGVAAWSDDELHEQVTDVSERIGQALAERSRE